MAYQRKNTDNTVIDINSDAQPEMTNSYSLSNHTKVGLAVTSVVGMMALWRIVGFSPSLSRSSDEATPGNLLENPYQLISSRDVITLADNSFPQPRHAKRAGFGREFQINTYTTDSQSSPSVTSLNSGDFVVVWQSSGQDGDSDGIYGQRFSNIGTPQGSEFQINTYATDTQRYPSVAGLSTGDFVVVWESYEQDGNYTGIYGQRFSSIGISQGSGFQINTYTTDEQENPSVAALTTGDFVVAWASEGQDGSGYGVYGQRYSSTGIPQGVEFQINTYTTSSQSYPSVAGLSTGDFVVVWSGAGQGDSSGIYGQRFSGLGVPQDNEFRVNTYTTATQSYPSVAGLSTGVFVVVWQSDGQDGSGYGLYGQRYSSTGTPQGSEFQINTYTTASQASTSVAILNSGDFVVVWDSNGQDGGGYGIYGQRFSSTGISQESEFQINTYATSGQHIPSVAALTTGGFVVAWRSGGQDGSSNGIYGRIYFTPVLINNGLTVLTVNELFNIDIGTTNTTALSFDTIEITQVDPSLTINWDDTKATVDTVTIPDITSGRKVEITSDGTNANPTMTTKTCKGGICSEEKTTTLATAFSLDNGNGEQIPIWLKVGGGIGAGVLVAGIVGLGIFAVCKHNKKQKPRRQQTHELQARHTRFAKTGSFGTGKRAHLTTTDRALSENPNAQSVPGYVENNDVSLLEDGINTARQIFSPKAEFV